MEISRLPFQSQVEDYERQAHVLLSGYQSGDPDVIRLVRKHHPSFLDARITWLPRRLTEEELRSTPFELEDARLAVARWYGFLDWPRLVEWVEAVLETDSSISRFETAVECVIGGDGDTLRRALGDVPGLVRMRSTRVTPHDPPVHGASLLHYLAANGVEGHRQKVPANAVEIARLLLEAGAEADALAGMYGGKHTTMSMLVSSGIVAKAGVQAPLVDTLIDFGADVEGRGEGTWVRPLDTALSFGCLDAAQALVRRGARVDTVAAAAGLGRVEDVNRLLPAAPGVDRHRALALAAQLGHADIVELLLDAGEDPNRYNPEGNHAHSTPLHQAVWGNHRAIVELLVRRGARLDVRDRVYDGTPLAWAEYGGRTEIAAYLAERGGPGEAPQG